MKKSVYIALIIGFVVAIAVNVKKVEKPKQATLPTKSGQETIQTPSGIWLPSPLFFCEEEVPIDRMNVKRALEEQISKAKADYSAQTILDLKNSFAFFLIREELTRIHLPVDLGYVPIIESGLVACKSSVKDAVGWWQFIAATATKYRLEMNKFIDQRCDLFASTKAATNYLGDLHKRFKSWSDALAGYNMNEDTYSQTKARQNAKDYYQVGGLPQETQEFVYKIIAMKLIMEYPERYGYPQCQALRNEEYRRWKIHKALIDIEGEVAIDRVIQKLKDAYPAWLANDFIQDNPHILKTKLSSGPFYFYVYERSGTS